MSEGIINAAVGSMFERYNPRFNNSMPWYLLGVILVIPSFYLIMSRGVLSALF
jgi:hypothetical protein